MIYTPANIANAASGTPKALATSRTVANWLIVACPDTNTSDLYVGGIDPVTKGANSNVSFANKVGIKVSKGTSQLIPSISAVPYIDLSTVYFDVGTNGDKVSITYAVR